MLHSVTIVLSRDNIVHQCPYKHSTHQSLSCNIQYTEHAQKVLWLFYLENSICRQRNWPLLRCYTQQRYVNIYAKWIWLHICFPKASWNQLYMYIPCLCKTSFVTSTSKFWLSSGTSSSSCLSALDPVASESLLGWYFLLYLCTQYAQGLNFQHTMAEMNRVTARTAMTAITITEATCVSSSEGFLLLLVGSCVLGGGAGHATTDKKL